MLIMFSEIRSFVQEYRQTLRNITWLGLSGILVKPLWIAFITILCARVLGDTGYGVMMTALSLANLTFSFTSWGIEIYLVREVASDRSRASLYFTNFLYFRLLLSLLSIGITLLIAVILGYSAILISTVLFACIYLLTYNLTEFNRRFFQAFEVLKYQAYSEILEKLLVIGGGIILLLSTAAPHWTFVGMATGMLLTAGWSTALVNRRLASVNRELFDIRFILKTLRMVIPFGLVSLFGMVYWRIDTVMIEAITGIASAGHYSLSFRIIEALNMLPVIVGHAAVYPRLSSLSYHGNRLEFHRLTKYVVFGLILASLPIAGIIYGMASLLIQWITSDPSFGPSVPALRLLIWTFPLNCVNNTFYVALIALNRQTGLAINLGLIALFNVIFNSILIPGMGINGAAIATVGSEAVLLVLNYFVYQYGRARLVPRAFDPVVSE